jgi:uridylate kinase
MKHSDAVKYHRVSYNEVLAKDLKVMDATAISLCRENKLPILVFDSVTEGNIVKVMTTDTLGTMVVEEE